MNYRRDIINEISDFRERHRFGEAIIELPMRLSSLEIAFRDFDGKNTELAKYFPVSLVACIETYFRMVIKDLIDFGEPYLSNAENVAGATKIDFRALKAVHGKSITVGELVAHNIKISSLSQIEATLTTLLGNSFLDQLRIVQDRWDIEVIGNEPKPMLSEPDRVFADVSKTFELRHIICHEIASAYEIDLTDIESSFVSSISFLRASDEYISEIKFPGAPLTQTDMNIDAGNSLSERREEMSVVVEQLKSHLDDAEKRAFELSQDKWDKYCEAWADFVAGERASGGTIWPTVHAGEMEAAVKARIEQLSKFRKLSDPL